MADVPPAAVTVTSTVPAAPAGEVAVMEPLLTTVTPVAALVPNFTVDPAVKLVPEMVTGVPPAVGPLLGLTPLTVGEGGGPPLDALNRTPMDEEAPAGDWVALGATDPDTLGS